MSAARPINVFEYLDYRAFLRDYYLDGKDRRGLSFRALSRRIGLKSSNFVKLVMDGGRNLSDEMAERFASALKLDGDAHDYFVALVRFNQAKTTTERNASYARLTGFRRYRKARPLELAHAAYHSSWYLPAIRELVQSREFREDPSWVASRTIPPITAREAEIAIATLLQLGLLKRDDTGRLVQTDELVSTGPETRGLHIRNYHRTMMQHAGESMDLVAASDRDISSLTVCVSESGLARLKERVQRFRRELLELSAQEDEPVQVVQMNFQLFPLTRAEGDS